MKLSTCDLIKHVKITVNRSTFCLHFKCSSFTLWWRHFPSAHTKVKDHNTLYTSGFNLCNVGHQSWNHNGRHYLSFRFTTLIWTLSSQHFKDHIQRRTSCSRWLLCLLLIFAAWRDNCILLFSSEHQAARGAVFRYMGGVHWFRHLPFDKNKPSQMLCRTPPHVKLQTKHHHQLLSLIPEKTCCHGNILV